MCGMAVKELIEQDKYTLWPQSTKISGIKQLQLSINKKTSTIDLNIEYNESAKNRKSFKAALNDEEFAHLQSNVNRLQILALSTLSK